MQLQLGAKDSLVYYVLYLCSPFVETESMRLSIECSGCKATSTSESSISPAAPKKEKPKTTKKEQRVTDAGKRVRRSCPPSSPSSMNCGIKKNVSNGGKKKSLSLSDYFDQSSPSSASKCSSHEEEVTGTQISSMCFSSEFSSKYYNNYNAENKKKVKVDRGVAVVEQSSDPYGDFRRSMVEMIMAWGRLRDGDLNRLLRSYLSLNPPQHHPVILKAFTDLYMGS